MIKNIKKSYPRWWTEACKDLSDKDEVMKKLRDFSIGTRPFFFPMHKQPVFKRMGLFKKGIYPVSEEMYKYGFYLPSGLTLKNDQIKKVCFLLKEILTSF